MPGRFGALISEPMLTTTKNHRSLRSLLLLVLLLLGAGGCAKAAPTASSEAPPPAGAGAGAGALAVPGAGASFRMERSRIVTMNVTIVADHFEDSLAQLRTSIDRAGGYVSDLHASGAGDQQQARVEIRVPAERAQEVRGSFGGLGEITSATEKVEDVTEQRADLDARIKNAKTQEKRLLEIMASKSGSVSDLVESEKELARVRENVERLEAQQRSLVGKVDYATINVTLMARSVPAWQTPGRSLANAGKSGAKGAVAVTVYASMAFLTIAPTMLPLALVLFIVYLVVRRRRAAMTIDLPAAG